MRDDFRFAPTIIFGPTDFFRMALLFCPPTAQADDWAGNTWSRGDTSTSSILGCRNLVVLNASRDANLERWWARLVVTLLRRRQLTSWERGRVTQRLGAELVHATRYYTLMTLGLDRALEDPDFANIASGLWLDMGVFRALSTNVTASLLASSSAPSSTIVDGFDSFRGLPEPWLKRAHKSGPINVYFQAGAFSWAEHAARSGLGDVPTPPTLPRVRLHAGLFRETLPRFLASQPLDRRVAWCNIDCDLYHGSLDVLNAIGPRLARGTRLHFHELLKLPDLERATAWLRSSGRGGKAPRQPGNAIPPSDEARALHEWLRMDRNAGVQLELDSTQSWQNREAALFVVRMPSGAPSGTSSGLQLPFK